MFNRRVERAFCIFLGLLAMKLPARGAEGEIVPAFLGALARQSRPIGAFFLIKLRPGRELSMCVGYDALASRCVWASSSAEAR